MIKLAGDIKIKFIRIKKWSRTAQEADSLGSALELSINALMQEREVVLVSKTRKLQIIDINPSASISSTQDYYGKWSLIRD